MLSNQHAPYILAAVALLASVAAVWLWRWLGADDCQRGAHEYCARLEAGQADQ